MNLHNLLDTGLIASSLRVANEQMKNIDFQKIIKDAMEKAKEQMAEMQKEQNIQSLNQVKTGRN